jgi:hypothetical protein
MILLVTKLRMVSTLARSSLALSVYFPLLCTLGLQHCLSDMNPPKPMDVKTYVQKVPQVRRRRPDPNAFTAARLALSSKPVSRKAPAFTARKGVEAMAL